MHFERGRRALRDDRVRSAVRFAIAIVLADGLLLQTFGSSNAALIGSYAVIAHLYFLDFGGDTRERFGGHLVSAAIGAAAVALGAFAAQPLWLAVAMTFVVAGLFAYARVLGGYVAQSAVGLPGAFFLPLMMTDPAAQVRDLLAGWLVGSSVAVGAALIVLPHRHSGATRRAMAAWLRAASDVATQIAHGRGFAEERERLEVADDALIGLVRSSFTRTGNFGRRQRALTAMVSRARWDMPVADLITPLPPHDDNALALASAKAYSLAARLVAGEDRIGTPLDAPDIPAARREDLDRLADRAAQIGVGSMDIAAHYPARVMSIGAMTQLWLAGQTRGIEMPRPDVGGLDETHPVLWLLASARRHSVWLQNAVRTGLGTAACVLIVREMGIEHGIWVMLAALSCLQVTFSAPAGVRTMAWMSLGGAAGVLVAGGLLALHPSLLALALLLPVVAALAKGLASSTMAARQFAYTPFVLVNLAVQSWPPGRDLALVRLEDVALGAVVAAVLTFLVFPLGVGRMVEHRRHVALDRSLSYLDQAVAAARGRPNQALAMRAGCVQAILAYESALDAAYMRPEDTSGSLEEQERAAGVAHDRLVGGDACRQIAEQRQADPRFAPVADAFAGWWSSALGATA